VIEFSKENNTLLVGVGKVGLIAVDPGGMIVQPAIKITNNNKTNKEFFITELLFFD